jgi:hypothetical protein
VSGGEWGWQQDVAIRAANPLGEPVGGAEGHHLHLVSEAEELMGRDGVARTVFNCSRMERRPRFVRLKSMASSQR